MTIGIGAICESGQSAVVAADKMVTFPPPMSIQMEPPSLKKIIQLTEKVLLIFSGGTADGEEIISGARPSLAINPKQPVAQIAASVRDSYARYKLRRVEETILQPLLGANFKDFQEMAVRSPASQILQQVGGMIVQHNLQADLLVVGMDDSGAHVYAVTHPGTLIPLGTTGFGAVGSGGVHAGVRMSLAQHTKEASLAETLYNVYESKRAAEVAPGVGKLTDLAVIKDGSICFASPEVLKELENAHKEKPSLSAEELAALEKVCDGFTKQPQQPANAK